MKLSKALVQCYKLQDLLFSAANETDCSKADKARLALAWERLEERKRVLRGKPLPGSLRPESEPPRRFRYTGASSPQFFRTVEPVPPVKAVEAPAPKRQRRGDQVVPMPVPTDPMDSVQKAPQAERL